LNGYDFGGDLNGHIVGRLIDGGTDTLYGDDFMKR